MNVQELVTILLNEYPADMRVMIQPPSSLVVYDLAQIGQTLLVGGGNEEQVVVLRAPRAVSE